MATLDAVTAETIRGADKIKLIAAKTGIPKGTLYRYGLPVETTGLDIPIRKLVPIMKAAGNYAILRRLAADCGYLLVREPRTPRNRMDSVQLIGKLQKCASEAVQKTVEFFEKPRVAAMSAAASALDDTACTAIGLKKTVLRSNQLELAF